jgi:uncharacterized protein
MSFAIDANILLYASDGANLKHRSAQKFLQDCVADGEVFCLCWPTIMAYLRISTHASIFSRPLSPTEAAQNIESLLQLPHCRTLSEEPGFWQVLQTVTKDVPSRGNLVPDTHIATLLRQHGVKTFYTHDRDFYKFRFLDVKDPL